MFNIQPANKSSFLFRFETNNNISEWGTPPYIRKQQMLCCLQVKFVSVIWQTFVPSTAITLTNPNPYAPPLDDIIIRKVLRCVGYESQVLI